MNYGYSRIGLAASADHLMRRESDRCGRRPTITNLHN